MHGYIATASSSPSHHYQYDDAGNRTSVLDLGVTTSYVANSVNAYTSISGSAAPVYDDNGNMTSGPLGVAGAASSALTYGKENNNLLSATGAQATNFVYDAMGRLVQFSYTENSVTKTEILTWAGWTLMTREIFTGNAVSETFRYTWGTDLSGTLEGAGGVGGLLAVERNIAGSSTWDIRYTHADANGNIIALTNNSGAVSARYRYDAFGKVLSATDVDASGWVNHNIHGFSSKPTFGNQGLLYYGYRWYCPALGRWINRDPIEESGGMNMYGFVGNDGVGKWDLLGLERFPGLSNCLGYGLGGKPGFCVWPKEGEKMKDYVESVPGMKKCKEVKKSGDCKCRADQATVLLVFYTPNKYNGGPWGAPQNWKTTPKIDVHALRKNCGEKNWSDVTGNHPANNTPIDNKADPKIWDGHKFKMICCCQECPVSFVSTCKKEDNFYAYNY